MLLSILAELRAARCQRERQGRLEWQGAQEAGGNREPRGFPLPVPPCATQACSRASPNQQASLDLIRWFHPILPRLARLHRLLRLPRRYRHRPCAFPFADAPLLLLFRDP